MDEGVIYEEGTPQQIFENPKREKTKTFIQRIRSLHHHISSREYDLYALQGEMEAFCEKHMLSKKVSGYVVHIAEEVLGMQADFSDVDLSLSYSEKEGNVELVCESSGPAANLLKEGTLVDDIGLKLIKARCKSVDYEYAHGKNRLILKVKGE